MPDRRGFIGACFAGLAGVSVAATVGPVLEVTRKLVFPKSLEELDRDGPICVTSMAGAQRFPEFISILDSSSRPDVWFGVTHRQITAMGKEKYAAFVKAHLQINHDFGYKRMHGVANTFDLSHGGPFGVRHVDGFSDLQEGGYV